MAKSHEASSTESAEPNNRVKLPMALLSPVHWPAWLGLGFYYLLSLLPLSLLDRLGQRLARWMVRHNSNRYDIATTNLRICYPELTTEQIEKMAIEHFEYLVIGLLHYGKLWWQPTSRLERLVSLSGSQHIEQAHAEGKQVIVLLSHCTGLEFAAPALAAKYPSSTAYKPFEHPLLDWQIARGRSRFNGFRLFPRDAGLRSIVREAREGRLVIYLADEDLGRKISIFTEFFGQPKATIPMLGRLARACDAVVIPAISCYDRQQHHYQVKLLPALEDFPTEDVEADTLKMNQAIEATIAVCPVQYFWTLKLFKTRPRRDEPKIY